jgi:hypothetical protein
MSSIGATVGSGCESESPIQQQMMPSPSRDMSRDSHFNPLEVSDRAREIILQLREELPELRPGAPLYARFDDSYLNRFAKARQFKYADVLEMVKQHIQWLREFQVASIMEFRFTELDEFRAIYPHGYHGTDKMGRPVYIERYSKLSSSTLNKITTMDRVSKYWVKGYETLLYQRFPSCRPGVSQSVVILDLSGVRLGTFDSKAREFLKIISKISSDNYPETLGAMFVVNVPSFFSIVYNIAKPFIPPETKKKIHVVQSKHVKVELLKFIDANQLPSFLGGDCTCDPASTTDDKGCLVSDKGPWTTTGVTEEMEDFVSCNSAEFHDSRSFVTLPTATSGIAGGRLSTVAEKKRKGFLCFSCCLPN